MFSLPHYIAQRVVDSIPIWSNNLCAPQIIVLDLGINYIRQLFILYVVGDSDFDLCIEMSFLKEE